MRLFPYNLAAPKNMISLPMKLERQTTSFFLTQHTKGEDIWE